MLSAFLFSATEVASSTIFDQWWLGMKDQAMAGQLNFWQNIYKEIYQNVLYNDRWLNYLRGMGITCGSRRVVERELADGTFAEIRVPDLTLQRHFYIAWHAEKRLTAGAERLRRVCHALAAAEAGQAA